MRDLLKYSVVVIAFALLGCGGGGKDPEPKPEPEPEKETEQELAFEKLSGTWVYGSTGSIKVDGQDKSLNYPGFSLSFAEQTYQTTNAGKLFSASGAWKWADAKKADQMRLDGKDIVIKTLTDTELVFTFTFRPPSERAGTAGISGNYTITLSQ